jgi:acyl-coenzyme A thioesterase PaaI-like protein
MSAAYPSAVPGALSTSAARRLVAQRLRALTTAFLEHEVDEPSLARLTGSIDASIAELAGGPPRVRSFDEIRREPEADEVADGAELGHFDQCFVTGDASPVGLAATVRRDGDGLVGIARFPRAFEGMPGYAHGGIVLAAFDDLIGLTVGRMLRISAPTVHVEVDFRRPVPLGRDIEIRTRLASTDGRKRIVRATASLDGELYAEAEGLLIVLPENHTIG